MTRRRRPPFYDTPHSSFCRPRFAPPWHHRVGVAAILIGISLAACEIGYGPLTWPVSGVVIDMSTGTPVPGVSVTQGFSSDVVTTDEDGRFTVEDYAYDQRLYFAGGDLVFPPIAVSRNVLEQEAPEVVVPGWPDLPDTYMRVAMVFRDDEVSGDPASIGLGAEIWRDGGDDSFFPLSLLISLYGDYVGRVDSSDPSDLTNRIYFEGRQPVSTATAETVVESFRVEGVATAPDVWRVVAYGLERAFAHSFDIHYFLPTGHLMSRRVTFPVQDEAGGLGAYLLSQHYQTEYIVSEWNGNAYLEETDAEGDESDG